MTISDEEYEIIKEALHNLMRHNSIRLWRGDSILELIATINASVIDLRYELGEANNSARHARKQADLDMEKAANTIQKLVEERDEAMRQAKMYLDGWRAATEKGDMAVELERCGDK